MNNILQDFKSFLKQIDMNIVSLKSHNNVFLKEFDFSCIENYDMSEINSDEMDIETYNKIKAFIIDVSKKDFPKNMKDIDEKKYFKILSKCYDDIKDNDNKTFNINIISKIKYDVIPKAIKNINYLVLSSLSESKKTIDDTTKITLTDKDGKENTDTFLNSAKNDEMKMGRIVYNELSKNSEKPSDDFIKSFITYLYLIKYDEYSKIEKTDTLFLMLGKDIDGIVTDKKYQWVADYFKNNSKTIEKILEDLMILSKKEDETPKEENTKSEPEAEKKKDEINPIKKGIFDKSFSIITNTIEKGGLKPIFDVTIFEGLTGDEKKIVTNISEIFFMKLTKFEDKDKNNVWELINSNEKNGFTNDKITDYIKLLLENISFLSLKAINDGKEELLKLDFTKITYNNKTKIDDIQKSIIKVLSDFQSELKNKDDILEMTLDNQTIKGEISSDIHNDNVDNNKEVISGGKEDETENKSVSFTIPTDIRLMNQISEFLSRFSEYSKFIKDKFGKNKKAKFENGNIFNDILTYIFTELTNPTSEKIFNFNINGNMILNKEENFKGRFSFLKFISKDSGKKNNKNDIDLKIPFTAIIPETDLKDIFSLISLKILPNISKFSSVLLFGQFDLMKLFENAKYSTEDIQYSIYAKQDDVFLGLQRGLSVEDYTKLKDKKNKFTEFYIEVTRIFIIESGKKSKSVNISINGKEVKFDTSSDIIFKVALENRIKEVRFDKTKMSFVNFLNDDESRLVLNRRVKGLFLNGSDIDILPIISNKDNIYEENLDNNIKTKVNELISKFLKVKFNEKTTYSLESLHEAISNFKTIYNEFDNFIKSNESNNTFIFSRISQTLKSVVKYILREYFSFIVTNNNEKLFQFNSEIIRIFGNNYEIAKKVINKNENGEITILPGFVKSDKECLILNGKNEIKRHLIYNFEDNKSTQSILLRENLMPFLETGVDHNFSLTIQKTFEFLSSYPDLSFVTNENVLFNIEKAFLSEENFTNLSNYIKEMNVQSKTQTYTANLPIIPALKVLKFGEKFQLILKSYIVAKNDTSDDDGKLYQEIISRVKVPKGVTENVLLTYEYDTAFGMNEFEDDVNITDINFNGAYLIFKRDVLQLMLNTINTTFVGSHINIVFENYFNKTTQIELRDTNSSKAYNWFGEGIGEHKKIGDNIKIGYIFNFLKSYSVKLKNFNGTVEKIPFIKSLENALKSNEANNMTEIYLKLYSEILTPDEKDKGESGSKVLVSQSDKKVRDVIEGDVFYSFGVKKLVRDEKLERDISKFVSLSEKNKIKSTYQHTPIYSVANNVNMSNLTKLKNTGINGRIWFLSMYFYFGVLPIAGTNANLSLLSIAKSKNPGRIRKFMDTMVAYKQIHNGGTVKQDEGANFVKLSQVRAGEQKSNKKRKDVLSEYVDNISNVFINLYKYDETKVEKKDTKEDTMKSRMEVLLLSPTQLQTMIREFVLKSINFFTYKDYSMDIWDKNIIEKLTKKDMKYLSNNIAKIKEDDEQRSFIDVTESQLSNLKRLFENLKLNKIKDIKEVAGEIDKVDDASNYKTIYHILNNILTRYTASKIESTFQRDLQKLITFLDEALLYLKSFKQKGDNTIEEMVLEHFYTYICNAKGFLDVLGNEISDYTLFFGKINQNKRFLVLDNQKTKNTDSTKYERRIYIDIQFIKGDMRLTTSLISAFNQSGGYL